MTIELPSPLAEYAPDGVLTPRRIRQFILDMAKRRQRPGTGSSREFMLQRTADIKWPDFRETLRNYRWVVVGGVATRAFMPERVTKDLDILVHARDGEDVIVELENIGYQRISRLAVPGALMRSPDGVEVDVIFGNYVWLDEALDNPTTDPAGLPVLDLPFLIAMKMDSGRVRDLGDVTTMIGWNSESEINRVREVIKRYFPDELPDLESMILLGQLESQIVDEEPDEQL